MSVMREWQGHRGSLCDSVNGFDVIECEPCGFKHIAPIPSHEEFTGLYEHEYYASEKPLYIERYREDLDWWNLVYGERYETFERLLPPGRRRLLDIGSGPGYFLQHGAQRGWETLGIEPSRQAAAHSRTLGLNVIEGFFDEGMTVRVGMWDVVHLHEVLEHVPDPCGMLRLIRRILRPGGLLCTTVPNDYNPLQILLRDSLGFSPWWLVPPHHINYFNHESIERLIQSAGFTVLHTSGTFPMEVFLLMGENYVGNDALGRRMHGMRKNLELNLAGGDSTALLRELYSALAKRGIGRECVVIAST